MYYVFLLRVIKLLACLHACLLWLTHSLVLYMPNGPKKPLHVHDLAPSRRILNPESKKIVLAESGIFRGFGIRNAAQGIQSPTNDWNPEPNFHWQRLESSTWNPESTAWNPESKTVLDSLTWSKTDLHVSTSVLGPFHCYRRNDANFPQWFIILLAPSYY